MDETREMNDKVKISCILTTFNRKELLKRAIKSVLAQSEKDFELIVVDDCSTDKTEQFVKSIKDKRVRYFKTEKNCGSDSQPKNIGIREAEAEFISFLDDDDIYRKDALRILSVYLKQGTDMVYGDYYIHDKPKSGPGWSIDFNTRLLQEMNYIAMSVVMVKRSALLQVGGFDETIPKFKDWNLWLRLQKRGFQIRHIPIIVSEVYPQKESISSKFKIEYDENGHYLPTFFNPADCEIWATKTILGEKKPLKVAIFTLTKDRLFYTKKMAETMFKLVGYPFDWFVVDQGSTDGTLKWLESFKKGSVSFFHNKVNVGIAKGWNQAIEAIKRSGNYDIIVKVDNDAEFMSKDWLKIMIEIFDRNRRIVLSPYVEGLEDAPGGVLRQRASGEPPYAMINDRTLGIVPFLGGICYAAPMELYDDWKFPEETFYQGNKDYLISQYAKSQGFTLFYVEELRVYHQEGMLGQKKRYPEYETEKEFLTQKKHRE